MHVDSFLFGAIRIFVKADELAKAILIEVSEVAFLCNVTCLPNVLSTDHEKWGPKVRAYS